MNEIQQNPRKLFQDAIDYALQVTNVYVRSLKLYDIKMENLKYLEIGPGADFAPQLVLASYGVKVTLADQYLSVWDPDYHPGFYSAFLERWSGPGDAIQAAIRNGGYSGLISLVPEPVEKMSSLRSRDFGFVQSNAVLEHVTDIGRAVSELARVTEPGGIHSHQIDFRDHRDFSNPLAHLLLTSSEYRELRSGDGGNHGTNLRLPNLLEKFSKYFCLWDIKINPLLTVKYARNIKNHLPDDSPYKTWPAQLLRVIGARVWLLRRDRGWLGSLLNN